MNKDRLQEFFVNTGIRISKSDLFQVGIHGITVKQIDKLNMSEGLSKSAKIVLWSTELAVLTGLVSCATNTNAQPTISSEPGKPPSGGSESSFGAIPTPELKNGEYTTETYCSDDLALCAYHQFDENGKALAPRASFNAKVNIDLDNNSIVITGEPLIDNDAEVYTYDENGQRGYATQQVISVEDAEKWMESMTEKGRENMQVVIDEAKANSNQVRLIFKTIVNVQKNSDGKDELVNMIGGVSMAAGFENATIIELEDTLEPITKTDVLIDKQISAVDFVPQTDGTENLVMEVYPSDWVEIGNGQFVSPEFIEVMDKVAASGENIRLTSSGMIEETTVNGTTSIPDLLVRKNGEITITVNGEKVVIDSQDVTISNEDGLKIKGYKLINGEWQAEVVFNRVTKTENVAEMSVITMKDLEAYSNWILEDAAKQPRFTDITARNIDFTTRTNPVFGNTMSLIFDKKNPEESPKATELRNIVLLDLTEFGFPGQHEEVYSYIIMDSSGKIEVRHSFAPEYLELAGRTPNDIRGFRFIPVDLVASGQSDDMFIKYDESGKILVDYRPLIKNDTFYQIQGTSKEEVKGMIETLAETDKFSEDISNFFHTHIFLSTGAIVD